MDTVVSVRFEPDEVAVLRSVWPFTGLGEKVLADRAALGRVEVLVRVRDGLVAARDRLVPGLDPEFWARAASGGAAGSGEAGPARGWAVPLVGPTDPDGFAADMAAGRERDVAQVDAALALVGQALRLTSPAT